MDKFKDTIITDAGRKLLINVGAGNGEIAYTRAVLAGQDVSSMADEDIRKLATLENQKMEVNVAVTPPQDNTITVSASFGNKDLTDDLTFSSVGWYAKNNNDNKEILLGVSPSNGDQTLVAGSPDHRSTASIDIDLAMAISNAAKVDLTVNEIGVAHMSDVNAAILKLKAEYDPKIAEAGKVKGAKINDGAVVEPDDDGILNLFVDSDRIQDFPAGVTDFNNLTQTGLYRMPQNVMTIANKPVNDIQVLRNAFLKVINDAGKTNEILQIFVSGFGGQIYVRSHFAQNEVWTAWTKITPSNTLSNDDITNMINSKVDGLNVGQFVKKVNGSSPDSDGNVNVTSTVARGFDVNANATTKMTVENLVGGNQILLDQDAGQDIVNWAKGQFQAIQNFSTKRDLTDADDVNNVTETGRYQTLDKKPKNVPNDSTGIWSQLLVLKKDPEQIQQFWIQEDKVWIRVISATQGPKSGWSGFIKTNFFDVDAPIYRKTNAHKTWSDVLGALNFKDANVLVSLRDDAQDDNGLMVGGNSAGIAFGGVDTKGILSVKWNDHKARITGGNPDNVWSEDVAWKSDVNNLQNQVNDLINQINYIKQNYLQGKRFPVNQEAQAEQWENANPNGIAMIEK